MSDSDYKKKLKDMDLLDQAERWLKKNPPPKDWKAGRYAWAFTEMPVLEVCVRRLLY